MNDESMVLQRSGAIVFMFICLGFVSTSVRGLARLDETAIEQRKAALVTLCEKNAKIRTIVKTVGLCAGAAVAIGGIYYLGHKNTVPIGQPISATPTLEELAKRLANVEQAQLRRWPHLGSFAWCKAAVTNFIFSPVTFLALLERATLWSFNKLSTVFYSPNLAWYVQTQTQLGVLQDHVSEVGQWEKHLVPGPLSVEIMHHVTVLDDLAESPIPVDIEFHKKCLIDTTKNLVNAMAGILAFMQYKATLWQDAQFSEIQDKQLRDIVIAQNKKRSIQVQDIVRYLFNYTNGTCEALENALVLEPNSSNAKNSLLTIMKGFFVELESELIRFKLIEQEQL